LPKSNRPSKASPTSPARPSAAEIAEARAKDERERLDWCRRAIAVMRLNRQCRSRRCRRNGCQDVRRCEPQRRAMLDHIRGTLMMADLRENSILPESDGPVAIAERKALLAHARKHGMLPWEETRDGDPNAPDRTALDRGEPKAASVALTPAPPAHARRSR
jgi:hypothetical protein